VFTDRIASGGAIMRRIISTRLSHREERRRYAEAITYASPSRADEGGNEGSR